MRFPIAVLALSIALLLSGNADAEPRPFTATLEVRASVDTSVPDFELLTATVSGVADVSAGIVRVPASVFSVVVPVTAGFGGTVVNGPLTFSAAGVGAGQTCPLIDIQELCWDGGGFGGAMRLDGLTRSGLALEPFGEPGTGQGGVVEAGPWTTGAATVFYLVPETDPTPFTLMGSGTFRGLPSTAPANAGLSVVTPMRVNTNLTGSTGNVRALARLRIDFPKPVPLGVAGALGALLVALGLAALVRR